MDISGLINERLIDINMQATSQKEAIEKLALLLEKEEKIESRDEFVKGVLEREKEATTGFGKGIAIPHCKLDSVKTASIAIGKLIEAVDWNSLDGEPVKLIIMLAVPDKEANTTHLQILSNLASKLMEEDFVKDLLNANNSKKIISLLNFENE
ncbi:PTS sugar transporter subunit IIA [Caldisalinibacter kiritimatiensis]|uniref:PTS system, fructose-specific IIA component n=1 Tax=Caldisalinibacter kiritimatiensis TaxID=1304284 RepID=R1AY06_9FIRM|nr:fructose PTS transporter subunit IIA [Caldisalinibacter kiritimatiensis]EOD01532.1 PTS system, fructose-specific IIA component [Caldisalinibacter kiritimatiensis]